VNAILLQRVHRPDKWPQNRHEAGLPLPRCDAISGEGDKRASERSSQMAKSPSKPQQGGSTGKPQQQQQGQQSDSPQQQQGQPIFRDWASI
jgi:hypothetical protein